MAKVVVGLSGGVDSSVTAALLVEQGHEVLGVHMQNWSDDTHLTGCSNWPKDRQDALAVATKLGIPFQAVSFEEEYKAKVMDYFFAEYAAGRTPNPDMLCNREIKFGMLLDWALEHGYEFVATGHYARVEHGKTGSKLLKGIDTTKDQSYFLAQLSQNQLQHALFPLGTIRKTEVRAEAAARELLTADKPDSQGLCFVGEINIGAFLKDRLTTAPGPVVTTAGEVVGEHDGAALYTVGQRKGVGVSKPVPMYVVKTDVETNTVTVGYDHELFSQVVETETPHWIGKPGSDGRYSVSIRYRMQAEPATLEDAEDGLRITFDDAQRGSTPGQFAAVYRGEELVGSAVIR